MKRKYSNLKTCFWLILIVPCFILACGKTELTKGNNFDLNLVFLTDIHLQPELEAPKAFAKVTNFVNKINPDFVLTGGDMIMDALEEPIGRVNMLYDLYLKQIKDFNMKVYHTIGNHEIFGWYEKSGIESSHEFYGKKMYEKYVGERYYSFNIKKYHIMILDSIQRNNENGYIGKIDKQQIEWIRQDLKKIDLKTPIILSTHIPFITVNYQLRKGALEPIKPSVVIGNGYEVLDLFKEYNLILVLQGHLHFYEEIKAKGVTYITGGAVSANWWEGPYYGLEEGFLLIRIKGETINSTYIDFDWKASVKKD